MIVHNQADADVIDYPIEDPKTKEVQLWSIKAGETLNFPDHVGSYLLQVYGFLQEVMTKEEKQRRDREMKELNEGRVFTQIKIVDKAPTKKVEAEGLSSETVQNSTTLPSTISQE